MTAPTVIRCSLLAGYTDCPRRAAARLFRREIKAAGFVLRYLPRGIGALVGSAVHRGVAHVLGAKAQTGTLPLRTVAIENSREALAEGVEGVEVQYDAPTGPTHNMRDAIEQVVRMTGVYHDNVAPAVNPVIVEERLEAEVEQGLVLFRPARPRLFANPAASATSKPASGCQRCSRRSLAVIPCCCAFMVTRSSARRSTL